MSFCSQTSVLIRLKVQVKPKVAQVNRLNLNLEPNYCIRISAFRKKMRFSDAKQLNGLL